MEKGQGEARCKKLPRRLLPLLLLLPAAAAAAHQLACEAAAHPRVAVREAAAPTTECPWGTSKRKQVVAGQMLPAVEVGRGSYVLTNMVLSISFGWRKA
jgi:hypothetical protein